MASEDINALAQAHLARRQAEQEGARRARAEASRAINAKQASDAEIVLLCNQFVKWASRNHITPNWRSKWRTGWILAITGGGHVEKQYTPSCQLAVSTSGQLYIARSIGKIKYGRTSAERVRSLEWYDFSIDDVRNSIARIVAESGKPW